MFYISWSQADSEGAEHIYASQHMPRWQAYRAILQKHAEGATHVRVHRAPHPPSG